MNDWRKDLGKQWDAKNIEKKSRHKLQKLQDKVQCLVADGKFRQAINVLERKRSLSDKNTQKQFWKHPIIKELSILIEKREAESRQRKQKNNEEHELSICGGVTHSQIAEPEFSEFSPICLEGNWKEGWALDLHTIESIPLGAGKFDTKYTKTGRALYLLKYCHDHRQVAVLGDYAYQFVNGRWKELGAIVTTPPSKKRSIQPVNAVASVFGDRLSIIVDSEYITKMKDTDEVKGIDDPEQRREMLKGAFGVTDERYMGKTVLLFDDIYQSGSTLEPITKVLYKQGKVEDVYVLTLTKTRTKR